LPLKKCRIFHEGLTLSCWSQALVNLKALLTSSCHYEVGHTTNYPLQYKTHLAVIVEYWYTLPEIVQTQPMKKKEDNIKLKHLEYLNSMIVNCLISSFDVQPV